MLLSISLSQSSYRKKNKRLHFNQEDFSSRVTSSPCLLTPYSARWWQSNAVHTVLSGSLIFLSGPTAYPSSPPHLIKLRKGPFTPHVAFCKISGHLVLKSTNQFLSSSHSSQWPLGSLAPFSASERIQHSFCGSGSILRLQRPSSPEILGKTLYPGQWGLSPRIHGAWVAHLQQTTNFRF